MKYTDRCPTPEQIRQLASGQLGLESSAVVKRHVDDCVLCAQTFFALEHAEIDTSPDSPNQPELDLIPPPAVNVLAPPTTLGVSEWGFLSPPLEPSDLGSLGGYRVLDVLGAGGMGVVFSAHDTKLKRQIALKVIKPHLASRPDVRSRFLREAQAVAAITHDNIVAIHQVGQDNVPYLVMPLLSGQTLADRLRDESALSMTEMLRVAREIANGLEAAHTSQVIHRDIKPANIWLEEDTGRVKLLDFGLARPAGDDSELTSTGAIAGTPLYMSPEQVEAGAVDGRADLYSLGCVLYRMLTGRPPLSGQTPLAALSAIANEAPAPPHQLNSKVSAELSDLVMRLLAKSPHDRPPSARVVADELNNLEQTALALDDVAHKEPPQPRDYRVTASLFAAACIILGAIIITIRYKDGSSKTVELPDNNVESIEVTRSQGPADLSAQDRNAVRSKPSVFDKREPIPFPPGTPLEIEKATLVASIGDSRLRHWGGVLCTAFHPDGSLLATGGIDRLVRIWDAQTGEAIHVLRGHDARIHSLAFSPNGALLVSADGLKKTIVWDIKSGHKDFEWIAPASSINGVSFDAQGQPLAIGARPEGAVVWEIRSGARRFVIPQKLASSKKASLSPDGRSLAMVIQAERELRVYDTATGALRFARPARMHLGAAAVFSADSSAVLYIPSHDLDGHAPSPHPAKSVAICDAITGETRRTFDSESAAAVGISPDGTLASTGGVYTTRVWETATGREVQTFAPMHGGMVHTIAIESKNQTIAIGDHGGTITLASLSNGKEIHARNGHDSRLSCLSFNHDGSLLATGGLDRKTIVWDLHDLQPRLELPPAVGPVTGVWFSRDKDAQHHLLVACDGPSTTDKPGQLTLWNTRTDQLVGTWPNVGGRVADASLYDTMKVVSIHHDGAAYVLDLQSRERTTLPNQGAGITAAALDPSGRFVVTGSGDGKVLKHELDDGGMTRELMRNSGRVTALSFSPDGRTLASTSQDGRLQIWDMAENKEVKNVPWANEVTSVDVAPNGDRIACLSESGALDLWSQDQRLTTTVFAKSTRYRHQTFSGMSPIAFSPEGRYLASANPNGTVFVLRIEEPSEKSR